MEVKTLDLPLTLLVDYPLYISGFPDMITVVLPTKGAEWKKGDLDRAQALSLTIWPDVGT